MADSSSFFLRLIGRDWPWFAGQMSKPGDLCLHAADEPLEPHLAATEAHNLKPDRGSWLPARRREHRNLEIARLQFFANYNLIKGRGSLL